MRQVKGIYRKSDASPLFCLNTANGEVFDHDANHAEREKCKIGALGVLRRMLVDVGQRACQWACSGPEFRGCPGVGSPQRPLPYYDSAGPDATRTPSRVVFFL